MAHPITQIHYSRFSEAAAHFSVEADSILSLHGRVTLVVGRLQRGGWQTEAAEEFYRDMHSQVLPAIDRLKRALSEAGTTAARIAALLRQAEEEAASFLGAHAASSVSAADVPLVQAHVQDDPRVRAGQGGRFMKIGWQGDVRQQQGGDGDPGNPGGRSEDYREWADAMADMGYPYNQINFYSAAARVTSMLGLFDSFRSILEFPLFGGDTYSNTGAILDVIGARLYALNVDIHERLINGEMINNNGDLISPLAGFEGGPIFTYDDSLIANNPLEWDVHMVMREQLEVEAAISYNPDFQQGEDWDLNDMAGIDNLLNFTDSSGPFDSINIMTDPLVNAMSGDTTPIAWAETAIGTNTIGFINFEHRVALGIAYVYQEHYAQAADTLGLTYDEAMAQAQTAYLDYMESFSVYEVPPPVQPAVGAPPDA